VADVRELDVPAVDARGRDVLFLDRPALTRRVDGVPVVDPAPKVMNVVEPGELVVDGVVVDPASPRWRAARDHAGDVDALRELGIGVVVHPDGRVVETGAPARGLPDVGRAFFGAWLAMALLAAGRGLLRTVLARHRRRHVTSR